MTRTNKSVCLVILIMILFVNCKNSNTNTKSNVTQNENEVLESNDLNSNNGMLIGKKNKVNYGKVKRGDTIKQNFIMVNQGVDDVKIISYTPSCDCTNIDIEKFYTKPGDSTIIKMLVVTDGKPLGNDDVTTTLKTNGKRPFHLLRTRFEVIE